MSLDFSSTSKACVALNFNIIGEELTRYSREDEWGWNFGKFENFAYICSEPETVER